MYPMQKKWKIWVYKGNGFTDCIALNSDGLLFRTRVSNTNEIFKKELSGEEFYMQVIDNFNAGEISITDIFPVVKSPRTSSLKEGINSHLIIGNARDSFQLRERIRLLFDNVTEVDENKVLSGSGEISFNESKINTVLRPVLESNPDLIFIAFNNKLLETTIANLLKTAGHRNVVGVISQ